MLPLFVSFRYIRWPAITSLYNVSTHDVEINDAVADSNVACECWRSWWTWSLFNLPPWCCGIRLGKALRCCHRCIERKMVKKKKHVHCVQLGDTTHQIFWCLLTYLKNFQRNEGYFWYKRIVFSSIPLVQYLKSINNMHVHSFGNSFHFPFSVTLNFEIVSF